MTRHQLQGRALLCHRSSPPSEWLTELHSTLVTDPRRWDAGAAVHLPMRGRTRGEGLGMPEGMRLGETARAGELCREEAALASVGVSLSKEAAEPEGWWGILCCEEGLPSAPAVGSSKEATHPPAGSGLACEAAGCGVRLAWAARLAFSTCRWAGPVGSCRHAL